MTRPANRRSMARMVAMRYTVRIVQPVGVDPAESRRRVREIADIALAAWWARMPSSVTAGPTEGRRVEGDLHA